MAWDDESKPEDYPDITEIEWWDQILEDAGVEEYIRLRYMEGG